MIEHYKFKTKPYEHQLKALEASWDKKNICIVYGNGYRKVQGFD